MLGSIPFATMGDVTAPVSTPIGNSARIEDITKTLLIDGPPFAASRTGMVPCTAGSM